MANHNFKHYFRDVNRRPSWSLLACLTVFVFSFACSRPSEGLESLFWSMEERALEGNDAWSTPEKEMRVDGLSALWQRWAAWEIHPCYFSMESQSGLSFGPRSHARFRAIVHSQDHYAVWHKPYPDDASGHVGGEEYQAGEIFWGVARSGRMEGASAWRVAVDEQKQFFPNEFPFGWGTGLSPLKQMLRTSRDAQATSILDEETIQISLVSGESGVQKTTILTVSRKTALPSEIRVLINGELDQVLTFHDFRILQGMGKDVVHFDEHAVDFFLMSDEREKKN